MWRLTFTTPIKNPTSYIHDSVSEDLSQEKRFTKARIKQLENDHRVKIIKKYATPVFDPELGKTEYKQIEEV